MRVETDPTVPASIKDGITWEEVGSRPSGLDDGDDVGLTTETDPVFAASAAATITSGNLSDWNSAGSTNSLLTDGSRPMQANFNLGGIHRIVQVADPVDPQDAVTKLYLETKLSTMIVSPRGDVSMGVFAD